MSTCIHLIEYHPDSNKTLLIPLFKTGDTFTRTEENNVGFSLYEDYDYDIALEIDNEFYNINSIKVILNETQELTSFKTTPDDDGLYRPEHTLKSKRIFSTFTGQVIIYVEIILDHDEPIVLESFQIPCNSQYLEINNDIEKMLDYIVMCEDDLVNKWILDDDNKYKRHSYITGYDQGGYKSITTYIALLQGITRTFSANYNYFRLNGKKAIRPEAKIVSLTNTRKISRNSIEWIIKNTELLKEIPYHSGIEYNKRFYVPEKIPSDIYDFSWNVYENKVLIGFLYSVLSKTSDLIIEYEAALLSNQTSDANPIKEFIRTLFKKRIQLLDNLCSQLTGLTRQYSILFEIDVFSLATMPRLTKTFQEIHVYKQIYLLMNSWFNFGEVSSNKDKLLLRVPTLDKLYEVFCLYRILEEIKAKGFKNQTNLFFNYKYSSDNASEKFSTPSNTFTFTNNQIDLTLYYEPCISASDMENDLSLFVGRFDEDRNKDDKYYTPDFVIKIKHHEDNTENNEQYLILDAKYSSVATTTTNHINEAIRKYWINILGTNSNNGPSMVWLLNFKSKWDDGIYPYYNTPLSMKNGLNNKSRFGVLTLNPRSTLAAITFTNQIKQVLATSHFSESLIKNETSNNIKQGSFQ